MVVLQSNQKRMTGRNYVFAAVFLLSRQQAEKRRSSVLISAETIGGTVTLTVLIVRLITNLFVQTAGKHSRHMAIKTGNIAVTPAILRTDSEVAAVTEEQMGQENKYRATMLIAQNLLNRGIISEKEYSQIDTMFQQKYAVSLSTLFTDISLINFANHGNM